MFPANENAFAQQPLLSATISTQSFSAVSHYQATIASRVLLHLPSSSKQPSKMASYPHNASTNKPKPWPAYFIVRTSGEVVPLIGVDELPVGTDLVGVPRALDLEDTTGMLNLGIQRSSDAFYQIQEVEKEGVEDRGENM
jgi:hypothetical protein